MPRESKSKVEPQKYPANVLAKSKTFKGMSRDFVSAVLGDECYTVEEAKKKIEEYGGVTRGRR